ncbi:hypothetical protein Barb4_00136 [Bacteroidales bacterium Barb4]|nr:hypothetical protein Barb4_00136 [Bacteroidales bacterium Barb4]
MQRSGMWGHKNDTGKGVLKERLNNLYGKSFSTGLCFSKRRQPVCNKLWRTVTSGSAVTQMPEIFRPLGLVTINELLFSSLPFLLSRCIFRQAG